MKRQRIVLGTAVLATFAFGAYLAACGGDDSTPISGTDGGGADGASDGSTFDATQGTDSGGRDAGSDTGVSDAGLDGALLNDAGQFTDAAPGGDAAVLNCGGASCDLPSQTCCLYDQGGDFSGGCANGAGGCPPAADGGDAGLVALSCEVTANCPGAGEVCCITHDANNGTIKSGCMLAATCVTVTTTHRAELCDPTAADAGCTITDPGPCTSIDTWDLPSGFGTCGGVSAN